MHGTADFYLHLATSTGSTCEPKECFYYQRGHLVVAGGSSLGEAISHGTGFRAEM